ncbi:MAG: sugar ABC transporter permease [Planctomycetota bacterium]
MSKSSSRRRRRREVLTGLAFLAPNILGFLGFTLVPLVFALMLAFTDWDLTLHNMFQSRPLDFVGLDNFERMINEPRFWNSLGRTLFMMMGIPFGIAGSLLAAILLTQNLRGGSGRNTGYIIAGAILLAGSGMLTLAGLGSTAMTLLVIGVAGTILVSGSIGGSTVYRTLFYTPYFTAGVATYLLWKKMYAVDTGPINVALTDPIDGLTTAVRALPAGLVQAGAWLCAGAMVLLLFWGVSRLRRWWREEDLGVYGLIFGGVLLGLPVVWASSWGVVAESGETIASLAAAGYVVQAAAIGLGVWLVTGLAGVERTRLTPSDEGLGSALILCAVLMIGLFAMLGLSRVLYALPAMAASTGGLKPPEWISDADWAKPSLIMMGLWAAIGSNNMLLYLAGLSNVPGELYEAADIDGAGRFGKFWNITWPQLAPVTFFIVVMSVIGGLQGGFEMVKTMTNGGPRESTTLLSFYIYTEAFELGRLGYASAVTWTLFGLVLSVTLFNWKFGNRYVNG